jgi:hypothetical protein
MVCTPDAYPEYADISPVGTIGYGAQAVGKSKPNATITYVVHALFILLAPILFAASV